MAKHTMQYVVSAEHLDVDPSARDYAKIKLADRLMMAVRLEASFGEKIVSLGPVSESQDNNLSSVTFEQSVTMTPLVRCKDCRHRDPEDKKCDSGALERAGCLFPVDDDYFCADGERKGGHS